MKTVAKAVFICVTLVAGLLSKAAHAGGYPLYISTEKVNNSEWRVFAYNKGAAPVTVKVELEDVQNVKVASDLKGGGAKTLEPGAGEALMSISVDKPQYPAQFQPKLMWVFGRGTWANKVKDDSVYRLPFPSDLRFDTLNGASWPARNEADKHAINIMMPEGTPVIAARAGTVIDVRGEVGGDKVKQGTFPWYEGDGSRNGNYVRILHQDGTWAEYMHLMDQSVTVTIGQHVEAGTQIAMSGKSGATAQPNLRFNVLIPDQINKAAESEQFVMDLPDQGVKSPKVGDPIGTLLAKNDRLGIQSAKDPLMFSGMDDETESGIGKWSAKLQRKGNVGSGSLAIIAIGVFLTLGLGVALMIPTSRVWLVQLTKRGRASTEAKLDEENQEDIPETMQLTFRDKRPARGYLMSEDELEAFGFVSMALVEGTTIHSKVALHRIAARPRRLQDEDKETFQILRGEAIDFLVTRESDSKILAAVDLLANNQTSEKAKQVASAKRAMIKALGIPYIVVGDKDGPTRLQSELAPWLA